VIFTSAGARYNRLRLNSIKGVLFMSIYPKLIIHIRLGLSLSLPTLNLRFLNLLL
jgi:hypothetical protein